MYHCTVPRTGHVLYQYCTVHTLDSDTSVILVLYNSARIENALVPVHSPRNVLVGLTFAHQEKKIYHPRNRYFIMTKTGYFSQRQQPMEPQSRSHINLKHVDSPKTDSFGFTNRSSVFSHFVVPFSRDDGIFRRHLPRRSLSAKDSPSAKAGI